MGDQKTRPGEFVMRVLFAEFTAQAEKKIEAVMLEPPERSLSKSLQRGEDPGFDQLLVALGSVSEHCLPSILRTLFAWYDRQAITWLGNLLVSTGSVSSGTSSSITSSMDSMEKDHHVVALEPNVAERRDMAVEFIFCLVLIEVLKQLPFHPGHTDLVAKIEDLAFAHFKYREGSGVNAANSLVIADLYAEVLGVLAQARFMSVRVRFLNELAELRGKEATTYVTQSIISLLMGMKFFRIKMAPIEDFEASFQFLTECAKYFLEVKQRDIKHALAGLFVEILVPVAAAVKHEVNVPCLKSFVEMLYAPTLDMCTRSKHRLALFPLVTCLLCVSQRPFFLHNWHYFLAMCLSQLKSREPKMSRVALESLYRLLWAYMIRIKCESNSATQSRLLSVVNSLFPKGSKGVVPRDTPLNIFVKIIQFIAQERLDFAMREIVFELLSVGRPIKIILAPERMNIGLRAFLVAADALQQKDGDPPMPRSANVMPSGNTLLRVKKTFLNKVLTEDTARSIGMAAYFPLIRKVFTDILRALDLQCGKPLLLTTIKEQEENLSLSGDRKGRIELFRTCVAAIPRLIPEGMPRTELLSLLSRLTLHVDEELRGQACLSLQCVLMDFPDWRTDVVVEFIHFVSKEVPDTSPQQLDNSLKLLLQLLTCWRNAVVSPSPTVTKESDFVTPISYSKSKKNVQSSGQSSTSSSSSVSNVVTLHQAEGLALLMLCSVRSSCRRLGAHMLKEIKSLADALGITETPVVDVLDKLCPVACEKICNILPANEKQACLNAIAMNSLDLQWLTERSCPAWYTQEDDNVSSTVAPISQPLTSSLLQSSSSTSTSTLSTDVSVTNDPWASCLKIFMDYPNVPAKCPRAVIEAWTILMPKLTVLYNYLDPSPVADSRASLLRGTATTRKPLTNRNLYLKLWRNYLLFAFKTVPTSMTATLRCISPDIMSSSPEAQDGREGRSPLPMSSMSLFTVSPSSLYKQILPLVRNDTADFRELAVVSIGHSNHLAIKDIFEELAPYLREACDRKQENVRRRKRKDNLRLQLLKILEMMAEEGTFGHISSTTSMCDTPCSGGHGGGLGESTLLPGPLVEFLESCKPWLELETDREGGIDMRIHFCNAIFHLLNSFHMDLRENLVKKEVRRQLFQLCISWAGPYSVHMNTKDTSSGTGTGPTIDRQASSGSTGNVSVQQLQQLDFAALQAATSILTCGPCFQPSLLADESQLYTWLDFLLANSDGTIAGIGEKVMILLLEFNPDCGSLLDWVVSRCFTGAPQIGDACFRAISTLFSAREYPCDRYVAIINVALLYCGHPNFVLQQTAFRLLQILDKRFFGESPLHTIGSEVVDSRRTLDSVLARLPYTKSQSFLSRQLSLLHPELTMPIFSEISWRMKSARPDVRQSLLRYLQPWLHNMELVEPSIPPPSLMATPLKVFEFDGLMCDGNRDSFSSAASSCSLCGRKGMGEGPTETDRLVRHGWGSTEATEMVLNNLLYLTAKFGDDHDREIEECWQTLCCSSANNQRVLLYYLLIVTVLAPNEILPHAKRVIIYLFRARPGKLLEDLVAELQTVESLNWLVERTEIPPFYRLSHLRKTSSYSDTNVLNGGPTLAYSSAANNNTNTLSKPQTSELEKGMIHTKRRSAEESIVLQQQQHQHHQTPHCRSSSSGTANFFRTEKTRTISGPAALPDTQFLANEMKARYDEGDVLVEGTSLKPPERQRCPSSETINAPAFTNHHHNEPQEKSTSQDYGLDGGDISKLVPLPMPEYGGYYAPLKEFLPPQPAATFHRCSIALMFLTEIVNEGAVINIAEDCGSKKEKKFEWCSAYLPLLVHIAILSLDHMRPMVHLHGYNILINLLIVAGAHKDHFSLAKILLNQQTKDTELGLYMPGSGLPTYDFLDPDTEYTTRCSGTKTPVDTLGVVTVSREVSPSQSPKSNASPRTPSRRPHTPVNLLLVIPDPMNAKRDLTVEELTVSFVKFLAEHRGAPLWSCEDINARVWKIRSANQLSCLLQGALKVFTQSYPNASLERKWAQISLQIGLACSSRHYAGRSLQVYRALKVPLMSRVLCDILSRLVETVAEPGDDMQGYVTELILTLESSVEAISVDKPSWDTLSEDNNASAQPPKPLTPPPSHPQMRARSGTENFGLDAKRPDLPRSRSVQSLTGIGREDHNDVGKLLQAETPADTVPQVFWLAISLLESDYEYEYLLALGLLEKVMERLPLERFEYRDKVERVQSQLQWNSFPGIINLVLKGTTNPNTYEQSLSVLCLFIPVLDFNFVDPTCENGFPLAVMALLPFLLSHYDDPSPLCLRAAQLIAIAGAERGEDGNQALQHLSTVMTLYSRRSFSKESLQWTKCVVKYLFDSYAHLASLLLCYLLDVLEKGPTSVQPAILNALHCCFTYADLTAAGPVSPELLRAIEKHLEGQHWRESLRILKLVVTRSSSLVAPPPHLSSYSGSSGPSSIMWDTVSMTSSLAFSSDVEMSNKKELPGRTMEFTFDVSQTPIIGRRHLTNPRDELPGMRLCSTSSQGGYGLNQRSGSVAEMGANAGGNSLICAAWKRPWQCQSRVRECLINVLNACGQRVGLPKSPSVIFSQSSELLERQSSVASSTEEVSVAVNDMSGASRLEDGSTSDAHFRVFRDFDFLEYELESVEGETSDNFNWGVRRRPLSEIGTEPETEGEADETVMGKSSQKNSRNNSESVNELTSPNNGVTRPSDINVQILEEYSHMTNPEESSDEEELGLSPLEDMPGHQLSEEPPSTPQPPSLNTVDTNDHHNNSTSPARSRRLSDTSIDSSSEDDTNTPCNHSPEVHPLPQVGEEPEESKEEEVPVVAAPVPQQPPQEVKQPMPVACFPELQFDAEDGDLV